MIHTPSYQFLKRNWRLPEKVIMPTTPYKVFLWEYEIRAPIFGLPKKSAYKKFLSKDLKVSFISVISGIAWVILSSSIGQSGTGIVPICPMEDSEKACASASNSVSFS